MPSTQQLSLALFDLTLRATLLLALAGLFSVALRKSSAATRHLLWTITVIALLALPPLLFVLPSWHALPSVQAMPTAPFAPTQAAAFPQSSPPDSPPSQTQSSPPSIPLASIASAFLGQSFLLSIWFAGLFLNLIFLATSPFFLSRIRRRAHPCTNPVALHILNQSLRAFNINRPVQLLIAESRGPFACGILRPAILVPRSSASWTQAAWQIVLRHELAHIRRLDLLTHLLAGMMRSLYWFHPLAWFACSRMTRERELACDDRALASTLDSTAYAQELLSLAKCCARETLTSRITLVGVLPMARNSSLERRVRALLNSASNREPPNRTATLATILAAIAFLLPVATLSAANVAPPPTVGAPATHAYKRESVYYISGAVAQPGTYLTTLRPPEQLSKSSAPAPDASLADAVAFAGIVGNKQDLAVTVIRRIDDQHETRITYPLKDLDVNAAAAPHSGTQPAALNRPTVQDNDTLIVATIQSIIPVDVEPPAQSPGEIYILGKVPRPGVYSIADRKLTVKQALVLAGLNLADLNHLEVTLVRRTNNTTAAISINPIALLAGTEPDHFIQANDLIHVTTPPSTAPASSSPVPVQTNP